LARRRRAKRKQRGEKLGIKIGESLLWFEAPMPIFLKIIAGALIPAAATIIFNLLNFLFENYSVKQIPSINVSNFDVAVGCTFSIIGICVAAKEHETSNRLLIIFTALILILIAGELLMPIFLHIDKLYAICAVDLLALFALAWSIIEVDQEAPR
jgi:hypothetical protein